MIFRSVKSGDRLPKILSQKVEFCIRIPLFSTKKHALQKYVLYEKNGVIHRVVHILRAKCG